MTRSVFVFGCAAPRALLCIAKRYGLTDIISDWRPGDPVPEFHTLLATSSDCPPNAPGVRAISFLDALRETWHD